MRLRTKLMFDGVFAACSFELEFFFAFDLTSRTSSSPRGCPKANQLELMLEKIDSPLNW